MVSVLRGTADLSRRSSSSSDRAHFIAGTKYCKACPYLNMCWGECPKNRIVRAPDGEAGLNYLCPGIKAFFNYAEPILVGIATLVKRDFAGLKR
ncbi:SPASM domain-containing protein [Enterobacter hormaechei]|uniref:SPASM domain-containing protein n=1 Tax=Enterobacter hormaechei TaxID=158836 RepID=UPI0021AE09E1|nr:SPASM domain-containing protein [Enterobacter hormaechei]MCU2308322.1 SPASM domain-containing protein [Enterobacter hormaechei subsp. hormaechei]